MTAMSMAIRPGTYSTVPQKSTLTRSCRTPIVAPNCLEATNSNAGKILRFSAVSTPMLNAGHCNLGYPIRLVAKWPLTGSRSVMVLLAAKDIPPSSDACPIKDREANWWWRAFSCLPYLSPLRLTLVYLVTGYRLHPFVQYFKFIIPYLGEVVWLWYSFCVLYPMVVRRKEWPDFFRSHYGMTAHLEMPIILTWVARTWSGMPRAVHWVKKMDIRFRTVVLFVYMFTLLDGILCALRGMDARIPRSMYADVRYLLLR